MGHAQISENFIMDGILDHFGSKLQQSDVDYPDEESMIHHESSDSAMVNKDASILASWQYYLDYSLFYCYSLLAVQHNIRPSVSHMDRTDGTLHPHSHRLERIPKAYDKPISKARLMDINTWPLGIHFLGQYLRRVRMGSIESCRTLIYSHSPCSRASTRRSGVRTLAQRPELIRPKHRTQA